MNIKIQDIIEFILVPSTFIAIIGYVIKVLQDISRPTHLVGLLSYEERDRHDRNQNVFYYAISLFLFIIVAIYSTQLNFLKAINDVGVVFFLIWLGLVIFLFIVVVLVRKKRQSIKHHNVFIAINLASGCFFSLAIGTLFNGELSLEKLLFIVFFSNMPGAFFMLIYQFIVPSMMIDKYDAKLMFSEDDEKYAEVDEKYAYIYYKVSDGYLCGYNKDINKADIVFVEKEENLVGRKLCVVKNNTADEKKVH